MCICIIQVLHKYPYVLGKGLLVESSTIHHILSGDIPVVTSSNEQVFLKDFIENKGGTSGGRLAR